MAAWISGSGLMSSKLLCGVRDMNLRSSFSVPVCQPRDWLMPRISMSLSTVGTWRAPKAPGGSV